MALRVTRAHYPHRVPLAKHSAARHTAKVVKPHKAKLVGHHTVTRLPSRRRNKS